MPLAKGARVLCGGKRHARGGNFFEPTVLAGVTRQCAWRARKPSARWRPCSVQDRGRGGAPWPTTPSSASPPISTRATSARCWRVGEALEYGMVGINTGLISNEVAPFGGIKQSGIGREGSKPRARGISGDQVSVRMYKKDKRVASLFSSFFAFRRHK
jgi:succinate-semialdehyde dehydrogenase/glutarate-semialdehyde dehydrogenase